MSDRTRELRTYAIGYVLSLVLTAAAFAMVRWPSFGARAIFGIVLALGLVQMAVQFRCFLHSLKRSSRHDLQLILFSTLIIALMVSGTLVILFNLRDRMM
jgi:cytochrome o ubiquinol oxidase operon protein cyoD